MSVGATPWPKTAERLVYRKLPFWIHNLCVTKSLLHDLRAEGLVTDDQLAELDSKRLQGLHAQSPEDKHDQTINLHEKLLLIVLTMSDRDVDQFLVTLEKHQPMVVKKVLGGYTTAEVMTGQRGMRRSSTKSEGGSPTSSTSTTPRASIGSIGSGSELMEGSDVLSAAHALDQEPPAMSLSEYLLSHGVLDKPDDEPEPIRIGPEGGLVDYDPIFLEFPPGALEESTIIEECGFTKIERTYEVEGQLIACGMVVNLYPHGIAFKKPVTVRVKDESIMDGGLPVLFISNTSDDELPRWENATEESCVVIDHDNKELSFSTSHFSHAAFFSLMVMSVTAMVAITDILKTKDLHFAIFFRRKGHSVLQLIICSSFDRNELLTPPGGIDGYQLAAGPTTSVPLAYFDTYHMKVEVHGGLPKKLDKNRLGKRQTAPGQWPLTIASCERIVECRVECCADGRGQVLLEAEFEEGQLIRQQLVSPGNTATAAIGEPAASVAAAAMETAPPPAIPMECEEAGPMSDECKRALDRNREDLLNMPREVLDHLVTEGIFATDSEDYQMIESHGSVKKNRNRELLERLNTKSTAHAFWALVRALDAKLRPDLAESLRKDARKIAED